MKILLNIDVPELAPAIEFYRSALGLSLSRTMDDDVAELTGGSSVIYLLKNAEGSNPGRRLAAPRRYAGHWTPVHIDFVVDDIEKAAERVAAAGGIRESECVEWDGS
jgi:predicted enzyme related to lactoylglutathione lyase